MRRRLVPREVSGREGARSMQLRRPVEKEGKEEEEKKKKKKGRREEGEG